MERSALQGLAAFRWGAWLWMATVLLVCTDGLLEHRTLPRAAGLERFLRAAANGPGGLDDLVDHVLATCTNDLRRDDDICLVGMRLSP